MMAKAMRYPLFLSNCSEERNDASGGDVLFTTPFWNRSVFEHIRHDSTPPNL